MATVKPKPASTGQPGRPRWQIYLAGAVGALLLLGVLLWRAYAGQIELGTAYAARIGCSCHYVAGRSLEDCARDLEDGMGAISLSADPEEKSVTGTALLMVSNSAHYREGWGCQIDVD